MKKTTDNEVHHMNQLAYAPQAEAAAPVTFYTPCKTPRPVRTSAFARNFAKESLDGKYGREGLEHLFADLSDIADFDQLPPYDRQDLGITRIAETAPLRHIYGELLVGSAAFGGASYHCIPASCNGKDAIFTSVSHLTCNFDRVLREGLDSFHDRIQKKLAVTTDPVDRRVLLSFENVYQACRTWHSRYLTMLREKISSSTGEEKAYYQELFRNLENVPFHPPATFREGLQALWFTFAFLRLEGNWPGLGRIDWMLGDLLKNDLSAGKITMDEARELMAHFFIKGCEWCSHTNRGSGDAQHYQNLVLGGIDADGNEISNDVTRLCLETIEEYPISDYPIAVRLSEQSPAWLKRKMAEAMRHGGGVIALYNEKLVIKSLERFGYSKDEAWQFANDGCWEVQIPGKTCFGYAPRDLLKRCQERVFGIGQHGAVSYDSYEALYRQYQEEMYYIMEEYHREVDHDVYDQATLRNPASVVSFFEDDCIDRARDYFTGGPRYVPRSPHMGGFPDLANNLYAIKKLVFDDHIVTYPELIRILENNWEGHEDLRLYARNNYVYYGNDNDEVDGILANCVADYIREGSKVRERNGVLRPLGISTFGRQIDWKDCRFASADGFRTGDILAGNISPTPSTDFSGATAIIRSCCKVDYTDLTCGTVLDIKLDPTCVNGEEGLDAIESLMMGFVTLGGFFMQLDVVDNAVLLEAQKHPENYQSLSVRVSGWSARFVTLNDDWQRMIIERSLQKQ